MTVTYASVQTDPCLLLPTETLIAADINNENQNMYRCAVWSGPSVPA